MNTKLFYHFLLIGIISWNACSDDGETPLTPEQHLPLITTTGANTFGCLIDGNLFVPRSGSLPLDFVLLFLGYYPNENDYNEIGIRDFKSERTASILIHIHNLHALGVGKYVVNESNGMSNKDGLNHNYMHCRVWRYSTILSILPFFSN